MKSKTSYFDKTIFRKDITRFAPVWGLYTLCLVMGMILLRQETNSSYGFHQNLSQLMPFMGVINLAYALLAAQLLFGDLYNTRMCNALHAMPVTRESLFGSHVAAGLCWSVGPTILGALLALLLGIGSPVEQGWQIPLYWLLSANLQYLFFFGVAVFSALCVGNRFAQAVVYAIINFASIIAYWLVDTLYTPMLYGIHTNEEPFMALSPAILFADSNYINLDRIWDAEKEVNIRVWFEIGDGWGYLAICAIIGIALLVGACLLYRKRQLECAGDFMAVKALEPVFLVVFPLIVAAVFHYFCQETLYMGGMAIVYLVIGLAVGFFAALMLLKRTTHVFSKKAFGRLAVLAVSFCLTLLVTALDPLGIVTWIPDADEVAYVEVSPTYYGYYGGKTPILDDAEEIEDILEVHAYALEHRDYQEAGYGYVVTQYAGVEDVHIVNNQYITLFYHLANGTVRTRHYQIDINGEAGQILTPYFNNLDILFGDYEGEHTLENILSATQQVTVQCDGYYEADKMDITDRDELRGLLEAIAADAELGLMAQEWNFRPDPKVDSCFWLKFDMGSESENITVYTDCVNTCDYLTGLGFSSNALDVYSRTRSYTGEETVVEIGGITTGFETD